QLGKVIDLDNEDLRNPINPQSVAQRDGTIKIETPEGGPRVSQAYDATSSSPAQTDRVFNLPEVEVSGELRKEVPMAEVDSKIGNEQYLEALLKFKTPSTERVDF